MRLGEGGFGGWHPREGCRVVFLPSGPTQYGGGGWVSGGASGREAAVGRSGELPRSKMKFGEGGLGGWHLREGCRVVFVRPGAPRSTVGGGSVGGFRVVKWAVRRLWGGVKRSLGAK